MRIDHGCPDIGVTQELLDRVNVVTCLQEMSGVGMPERMGSDALGKFCLPDRLIRAS